MPTTLDITPSPRVLRMLGQIDFAPWQCLAELIDNSVDAFIDERNAGTPIAEPRISVSLPTLADLERAGGALTISDNGPGMTLDKLQNAVKAGYSGNDPADKGGLSGMGCNVRTARLGRKTEVWTTAADSPIWTGIVIDFDQLERDRTFHAPVRERQKSAAEVAASAHGTQIVISGLESTRIRSLIWGAGKSNTKRRL